LIIAAQPWYTAAVHVIDFYLDDARAKERAQMIQLIKKTDHASVELLHGYVREGMRKSFFNENFIPEID
jgi:hypothetical protein